MVKKRISVLVEDWFLISFFSPLRAASFQNFCWRVSLILHELCWRLSPSDGQVDLAGQLPVCVISLRSVKVTLVDTSLPSSAQIRFTWALIALSAAAAAAEIRDDTPVARVFQFSRRQKSLEVIGADCSADGPLTTARSGP